LYLWIVLLAGSATAAVKIKVIVDNASIKATPEIGSQTLANAPLGTVLDVEMKQGEWYKVATSKGGTALTGYIHELLVEEVGEAEAPAAVPGGGPTKSQGEIIAEIERRLEEGKSLIREEKELDRTTENLRPLLAKAFTIDDRTRQKQIACEIYLWLGLASAKRGDSYGALSEFRNMFEVDYATAKEVTRNIYDPAVSSFIDQAEKQYRGLLVNYTLEITTDPKEAVVRINGQEIGRTPEVYTTPVPKFTLEVVKDGFKPYREEVFLNQANSKKEVILESAGRTVLVRSIPPAAVVFLDDQDTGKVTDCELPYVPYGNHLIRLKKPNWAEFEQSIEVLKGPDPLSVTALLTAKNYVPGQTFGTPEGKLFKMPRAIAIDKEGNFYVADESEFRLKKFDAQGRPQASWGDASREFKALKKPSGIAVDEQGFLYITDAAANCVIKFSKDGKFISKWGKSGSKPGELLGPLGIAVDRSGTVYVADSGNNRIVTYSTGGAPKNVWGKPGTGPGEFATPTAVAISSKNEILVVDRVHLQRFTAEGEVLAAWGKGGTAEGEFNRPMGLAVDSQDFIYVADTGNNRIQKFELSGKFITQLGSAGTGSGQMMGPVSVALSQGGSLFVLELDNTRIQEFLIPPD